MRPWGRAHHCHDSTPYPTQVKVPRTTFLSPANIKEKFQLGLFYTFSEDHEKLINVNILFHSEQTIMWVRDQIPPTKSEWS